MKHRTALAKLGLGLVSAAVLAMAPSAFAQAAAKGSTGTLTVVYEISGTGVERPASKEKNVTWTVKNKFEVSGKLTAKEATGFPALLAKDAAGAAADDKRMAAATQASKDMAPMMDQAAKIMEQCGDDEDCMMKAAMKMAQGVDMNSAQMKSAKANIGAASVIPGPRYQIFEGKSVTGTFTIDEQAHEAYFDAACSFKNEATCAVDTTVKGKGPLLDHNGKPTIENLLMGEIDHQAGDLVLLLPMPGFAKATKTATTQKGGPQVSEVRRAVSWQGGMDKVRLTAKCGACKSASGEIVRDIPDELLGRQAKIKISWTFTR